MPEKGPRLFGQVVRFIAVGAAGLLVDVVTFNALRLTVFSPHVVSSGPLLAKVVSVTAAIAANWIGNRNWTFRESRRSDVVREGLEFAVVSIAGSLVAVFCLAVSHYGLTSRHRSPTTSRRTGSASCSERWSASPGTGPGSSRLAEPAPHGRTPPQGESGRRRRTMNGTTARDQ